MSNKNGFVYFHQGMTDLVICMGLIDYYRELYKSIKVFLRSDAKEMMDFYIRGKDNVEPVYFNGDDGRYYGTISKTDLVTDSDYFFDQSDLSGCGSLWLNSSYVMLTHAEHDKWREDCHAFYWYRQNKKPAAYFSEAFYTFYDIPYTTRINKFNVNRDLDLEQSVYNQFIKENGTDYILYHDDPNRDATPVKGIPCRSTKINFDSIDENYKYVNLHRKSKIFFDYIKVIENAKELHLVDSVWACLIYQLDCRYELFRNKNINIYCQRGHYNLFSNPIVLPNWRLI